MGASAVARIAALDSARATPWLAGSLASARPALASTTGGTMPWDSILTTVQSDLTGPVATAVGVCACVIFGLSMAFGHEGSVMKRGMSKRHLHHPSHLEG